jgi:hypothetical protein
MDDIYTDYENSCMLCGKKLKYDFEIKDCICEECQIKLKDEDRIKKEKELNL